MYNSISGIFMAISIDVNEQIFENQMHALQACMTVDSEMGKRLRELIFQELKRVRNDIAAAVKGASLSWTTEAETDENTVTDDDNTQTGGNGGGDNTQPGGGIDIEG